MSNLVAWIGGAAGSFWSVELEAENLTHVRDLQPHGQTLHSSAGWLFPSWLFIDGIFLVREAQLAPPALHVQEDKEMKLGRRGTAVLFPSPTPCWGSSSTAQGSSEPLPGSSPGPRDGNHACGSHSWGEMEHFKHLLWLWKGIVNPQLASGIERGVKSVQCLPVRHKRIKWPQLASSDLCKLSLNVP